MKLFQKSDQDIIQINDFTKEIDRIYINLEPISNPEDLQSLTTLKSNFIKKTDDFFSQNRKLNIGVIGQVKAGKSSFLNTLLFNGKEILPKASTPKTATLTKMEYSNENCIEVEYYSKEDWAIIEDNAKVDSDEEIYLSARELVNMARKNGIQPSEHLSKGTERIQFAQYEDLINQLNHYVGEDGTYTPLVKAVKLYLNKEEFKDISIVDTPGLNDPIASRTARTKEFIEVCDVVFFLSQSSSFLDKNDWLLLSSQLPGKGVKKLVLIASKYDSGVRDILRKQEEDDIFGTNENTADNIPDACRMIARKLKKRARERVEEYEKDLNHRNYPEELKKVIMECKKPILISAMASNMVGKSPENYNAEEKNVHQAISNFSENIQEDLKRLGNMEEVQEIFQSVIDEKEQIMMEKAISFVPTAREELRSLFHSFQEKAEKRLALLSGNDREQLIEQKRAMQEQINGIKADILTTFGEWNVKLETEKAGALAEIRSASKEYYSISERTGTRTQLKSHTAYAGQFLFWKWGAHTEYYTYEEHYSYLSASDAIDNLRNFILDATNAVEAVFTETANIKEMKRKILNVVVNHFDMGSEKYDSSLFRIMVEDTVNKIEFPVIKIDSSSTIDKIATEFSGEVTSAKEKANLRNALSNSISKFFDIFSEELTKQIGTFKEDLNHISREIQKSLLDNITEEFDKIIEQVEHKEKEIESYKRYISGLKQEMEKL